MSDQSQDSLETKVRTVLANAPAWLRTELSAKDLAARMRAEEVLAAMIAAALQAAD